MEQRTCLCDNVVLISGASVAESRCTVCKRLVLKKALTGSPVETLLEQPMISAPTVRVLEEGTQENTTPQSGDFGGGGASGSWESPCPSHSSNSGGDSGGDGGGDGGGSCGND